jgi:hypothetical protein
MHYRYWMALGHDVAAAMIAWYFVCRLCFKSAAAIPEMHRALQPG